MLILDKSRALDRMIYAASTARLGVPEAYVAAEAPPGEPLPLVSMTAPGAGSVTGLPAGEPWHGFGTPSSFDRRYAMR